MYSRSIIFFTASNFIRNLQFAVPIQTIFLTQKGLSFTQIMILESILVGAIFLFEIPTGAIADRFGRQRSLLAADFIDILSLVVWILANSFWVFAVSYFLYGLGIAFASGAEEALIYDDMKKRGHEKKMQKVFGRYMAAGTLGIAIAAFTNSFIMKTQDLNTFYMLYRFSLIGTIISFFIVMFFVNNDRDKKSEKKQRIIEFKSLGIGFRTILEKPILKNLLLIELSLAPLMNLLYYFYQPLFNRAGVPNAWFGIALGIGSTISIFALIFAHKIEEKFGLRRGLFIVAIVPLITMPLMSFFLFPLGIIGLYLLAEVFSNFKYPIFSDLENRLIESKNRATILSTISFVSSIYLMVFRPFAGYLADKNLLALYPTVCAISFALLLYSFFRTNFEEFKV